MNWFIIILIGLAVLIVLVPAIIITVLWLKSYKRVGIIYQEVGDNPNHAHRTNKKFKVKTVKGLGQYLHFLFNMMPDSKSFSTKNWYYVKDGKKTLMGIPLYLQRDNYRPLILKKNPIRLETGETDSREFKLRRFIQKTGNYENNKLYFIAIGGFLAFIIILVLTYGISNYYLSTDVARAIATNTPSPIQIG